MTRTSFLDYYKIILDKVSFDRALFNKEYQKAIRKLPANEVSELESWLKAKGLFAMLPDTVKNGLHAGRKEFLAVHT